MMFKHDVVNKAFSDYNWPANITISQKIIWLEGARWQFMQIMSEYDRLEKAFEDLVKTCEWYADNGTSHERHHFLAVEARGNFFDSSPKDSK